MKESFPKIIVEGPSGPYEILLAGPVPSLAVFKTSEDLVIVGDRPGLERLARLADLVRERRDTVVSFSLRKNEAPPNRASSIVNPGLLDLVLAPKPIEMTPELWKSVRDLPSVARRRIALPELNDELDGARERLEFRQKSREMDRRIGEATLVLRGENTAFRALAGAAAYVARVGPDWQDREEYYVDWVQRQGEPKVMIDFDDPSRERD